MLTASATTTSPLWPTGRPPCDDSTNGARRRRDPELLELVRRVRPNAGDREVVGVHALRGGHDVVVGHLVQEPDRGVGIDVLFEDDLLVCRVARHRVGVL